MKPFSASVPTGGSVRVTFPGSTASLASWSTRYWNPASARRCWASSSVSPVTSGILTWPFPALTLSVTAVSFSILVPGAGFCSKTWPDGTWSFSSVTMSALSPRSSMRIRASFSVWPM